MTESLKHTSIKLEIPHHHVNKNPPETKQTVTFFGRAVTYLKDFSIGTAKTGVTIFALYNFVIYYFKENSRALKSIFQAPVIEELIFRGVLQNGIGLLLKIGRCGFAKVKNQTVSEFSTESVLAVERKITIGLAAVIFGLAHATNAHSSLAAKIFQVVHATLGGIEYGALLEETNTLAYSILGHAANNCIVVACYVGMISTINMIALLIILDISLLYVAYRGIEGVKNDVKNLLCLNQQDIVMNSGVASSVPLLTP